MTNDDVHSAVVRWVRAKTGLAAVIKNHQSGPTPALPYAMVNFTGLYEVQERPIDVEYAGEETITAAPVMEMEWRFSIHAYGDEPTSVLRPIVSGMKISQPTEPLLPGLTVHEVSHVRNVPDWINNAWQPRAHMDFIVRGIIRDGHVIDVIEEYSFTFERS
jgi:hypothetical protein